MGAAHACRTGAWRTPVTRPAWARSRHNKRLCPPGSCREPGGGPPMRCLPRRGTTALARPSSQCMFIRPPTMRGLTPGPWQPSSVSAHAMQAADRRVCAAQIAITRRSSEATHCCAARSHLSPSITPARHTTLLRRAASNHVPWKPDGGASPAQIASRSRHSIVKIPGLRERHFEAGARPRTFLLTANQRAPLPSADRRVSPESGRRQSILQAFTPERWYTGDASCLAGPLCGAESALVRSHR